MRSDKDADLGELFIKYFDGNTASLIDFFARTLNILFQLKNNLSMANQFIKVDIQGVTALINKSHIVVAKFGDSSVTRLQLSNGDIIEITHTPQLFKEIQS